MLGRMFMRVLGKVIWGNIREISARFYSFSVEEERTRAALVGSLGNNPVLLLRALRTGREKDKISHAPSH